MIILPQCNGLATTTIWYTRSTSQSLRTVLKLLNVHKACSDLDKGPALSWQLYLSLLFPMQWLSHAVINFSRVQLWTPSRKRIFNIEHKDFRFMFEFWGVMQEASHSRNIWQNRNEITQFTPKLRFYDFFWLKLGGVMWEVSRAIFSLWKKSKITLLSSNFISWQLKLIFSERLVFTFSEYYEPKFWFQLSLKKQGFM